MQFHSIQFNPSIPFHSIQFNPTVKIILPSFRGPFPYSSRKSSLRARCAAFRTRVGFLAPHFVVARLSHASLVYLDGYATLTLTLAHTRRSSGCIARLTCMRRHRRCVLDIRSGSRDPEQCLWRATFITRQRARCSVRVQCTKTNHRRSWSISDRSVMF